MKNFFFKPRTFVVTGIIIALFATSFYFEFLFQVAQLLLISLLVLIFIDALILFSAKNSFECARTMASIFSLNDPNLVKINLRSFLWYPASIEIIDEVPYQLQLRNFSIKYNLKPQEAIKFEYNLTPKIRGSYNFQNINIIFNSPIGLVQRRVIFEQPAEVAVYPSIIQMKKYHLHVNAAVIQAEGLKKIQRISHSYEFDHIKNYVIGEDPRSLNWKASSRRNELMVNHYEDEKSQQIYCILNKSRLMKMPFNDLSLLDYSINTCLTISNIVLNKADKIGLISFSDKIGTVLKANRTPNQLRKILNALYHETENNLDPNYELLYSAVRYFIPNRSLLLLFTNFETAESLERNLQMLRRINKFHLLVPIIFKNTELEDFINDPEVTYNIDIYHKVIARKMNQQKEIICAELKNHGIQYIYSKPEQLSINTINKYLELKSRGFI